MCAGRLPGAPPSVPVQRAQPAPPPHHLYQMVELVVDCDLYVSGKGLVLLEPVGRCGPGDILRRRHSWSGGSFFSVMESESTSMGAWVLAERPSLAA